MQARSILIIVVAYTAFMFFAAYSIVCGASQAEVPAFGCNEEDLRISSGLFAVSRGYLLSERVEDDDMIILQYGRENSETSFQMLQFCVSKRSGLYFARAIHYFVRKDQKDTASCELDAYKQLNAAKAAALKAGYVRAEADNMDFILFKGDTVIELGTKVTDRFSQFTILVWNNKAKGE